MNLILFGRNEGAELYEIYDSSVSAQSGGTADTHLSFREDCPRRGILLGIHHSSGSYPDWIQLQDFTGRFIQHHTLHHSIGSPAESRNPGLLAVGAAPAFDINAVEPYSSQGPTPDGRVKPDLVGADRGQSVTYRSTDNPDGIFLGTSQASSHVAGLAALVKQRFPEYSPQQVATFLKNHAEERGDTGADNIWGYGFARLLASDAAASTPEPTTSPEPTETPEPTATPEPTVTAEPTATPIADSCVELVGADGAVSGSWADDCASSHPDRSGRYARYYTFSLTESAEVTITLESIADPFLYLREGVGREGTVLCENDDYASEVTSMLCSIIDTSLDTSTDSGMVASLAEGVYTIEATTYDAGATGDFTLTASGLPAAAGPQPTPTPEPSPTPGPSPSPTPVPLPPDFKIEDYACKTEDLTHLGGFEAFDTAGPDTYENPGYLGFNRAYGTRWTNADDAASITCVAIQYDSISNARWSGLNLSTVAQRLGLSNDILDFEQAFVSSLIGDDMLTYRHKIESDDRTHTAATVRFLDAASRTVSIVAYFLLDKEEEYPHIHEPEGIARRIAARVMPADDTESQSAADQIFDAFIESFDWNR